MRLYFVLRFLRVKFILSFFLIISCIITLSKLFTQRTDLKKVKNSKDNYWKSPISQNKRIGLNHPSASARPFRKFVPGQFLKGITPVEKSYCNFKYGSDFLNWTDNISYSPELGNEGPYRVIYNVIEVNYKFENMSEFAVTYCTHATPEFLYHIVEIVKRWDSFVSVAVFVPGEDALISLIIIKHICRCFQEMSRISLHLVFPAMHPPNFVSNSYNTVNNYSSPLFKDCSGPDILLNGSFTTYKRQRDLIYPVNVARNVARMGAKTKYILVSDVELLPSKNLVQEFLAMLERLQQRNIVVNPTVSSQETRFKNVVFVLPVFEVESNVLDVPQTKYDLLRLYTKNRAVYFHRWVCLHCQRFPGLQRWLQRTQEIPKIIKVLNLFNLFQFLFPEYCINYVHCFFHFVFPSFHSKKFNRLLLGYRKFITYRYHSVFASCNDLPQAIVTIVFFYDTVIMIRLLQHIELCHLIIVLKCWQRTKDFLIISVTIL